MSDQKFVHLHVHTEFSLLDGLSDIKKLVERAKALEMPAVAITDHGTMFGVIDFFNAAKGTGIKPIIGVETYLAPRGMKDKDSVIDKKPFHLLLLAKNQQGYQNLLKIASKSQLEGYYYRPRIDFETLEQYHEGIIATSGCLAARIPQFVAKGRDDEAREWVGKFQEIFGAENFYLELQQHDIPELEKLNKWLVEYRSSGHSEVGLLATNDVHYVRKEDYEAHDVLLCVQTGSPVRLPKRKDHDNDDAKNTRMAMSDNSYYLNSADEMWQTFGHINDGEPIKNSLKIAEMCEVDLSTKGYHLPVFPVPKGYNAQTYLRKLCEKGLVWRYGERAHSDPVLQERLDYELGVINGMGFDTYFLIVWDLIQFAAHADIWWNVRGSGAGSLAAYCLNITLVDPIQNHLLFERFLNPGRVSMPDIDIDFPDDRRGELIAYAALKYGEDKVASIITFGTMGAKAAIKDVARVKEIDISRVNKVAGLIPTEAKQKDIEKYIADNPDLQKIYDEDAEMRWVIDMAKQLQGVSRHASVHAAGVIIADKPLDEYIPLHRVTGKDPSNGALKAVTQFPMETCESIGLLKVDFLGLSTLTIMRRACELIERYHGIHYDLSNIPYRHEDPRLSPEQVRMLNEAFELMGRGETIGVFQLESTGMQSMLRDMRPHKFEHIVAGVSLYRPGPMDLIPTYNKRLHGEEALTYAHPKLEPILKETYSIIVYQEQIMQIAGQLFGYELGEADTIRKAVSKKKEKELLKHKETFIKRGPENGVDEETAEKIFKDIEFFANYGFNKCLVGSTQIVDTNTGQLVTLGDLAAGRAHVSHTLTCDLQTLRLKPGKIEAVLKNGVKPVYRLRTQLGRQIEATANHPFYTFDGWRLLGELKADDKIAVPRSISVEGHNTWQDHQVIVLGHLLAEGNLTNPSGVYYYTSDEAQWQDYLANLAKFDNTIGSTHCRRNMYDVYSKRVDRTRPCGVVEWINQLGLRNTTSYTKFIPAEIFSLSKRQIGLLVARMWEGVGCIDDKHRSLYYATSSRQMVSQLQHLFLRLGIISRIREVKFPYKEGRIGYQLWVTKNTNLAIFRDLIAVHFVSQERREKLAQMVLEHEALAGTQDVVPSQVKLLIRQQKEKSGREWRAVAKEAGVALRELSGPVNEYKKGFTREIVGRLADYFDSDELRMYAENDIYWDKVVSIEYVGEQPTYDLTIEDTHNFIANDILVHNSHATDYAMVTVQTAYLKAHYPEEFMMAMLSVHRDDAAKIAHFMEECRRMNIPILQPDVNYSALDFDIQLQADGRRAIRFGLAGIKNAGEAAMSHIVTAREEGGVFANIEDFCRRIDLRAVGKRALESAIKVGAMEKFGNRAQLLNAIDRLVIFSSKYHKDREVGRVSLFEEEMSAEEVFGNLPNAKEYSNREILGWEKELLGIYVTGRPTDKFKSSLAKLRLQVVSQLKEEDNAKFMHDKPVTVAGEITGFRKTFTGKGDAMGIIQLEDWNESAGTIEVVFFPKSFAKIEALIESEEIAPLQAGEVVKITGKFDSSRERFQIIGDSLTQDFAVMSAANESALPQFNDAALAWMEPAPTDADYGQPTANYAPNPQPRPTNGHQTNGYSNGGGNGYADVTYAPSVDEYEGRTSPSDWSPIGDDDPFPPFESEQSAAKPRLVAVYMPRTEDSKRDQRFLKRLYGTLTKYPGKDQFAIVIEASGKSYRMDFAETTDSWSDDLYKELYEMVGQDNVEIHDN